MYSTKKHRRKLGICPNCNHILRPEDNFCPKCGQENHDLKVPLHHLIYEFIESIFHFDIKVWETLRVIVLKPGKVISDFNEGKRARYVPPARLYIFISVIFFFLVGKEVNTGVAKTERELFKLENKVNKIDWDSPRELENLPDIILEKGIPKSLSKQLSKADSGQKVELLDNFIREATGDSVKKYARDLSKMDTAKVRKSLAEGLMEIRKEYLTHIKKDSLKQSNNRLVEITNNVYVDSVTLWRAYSEPVVMDSLFKANKVETRMNKMSFVANVKFQMYQLFNTREKSAFINTIVQKALKYVSFMMFVLMPVVALILAFFYIRKKRFYYEHFIFSVMTHSVVFMIFSIAILIGWWVHSSWVQGTAMLLSLFYILASLKYVYRNGWAKTIFKFFIMFNIYALISLFLLVVVFGYSIII